MARTLRMTGMENASYDRDKVHECLKIHLEDKLETVRAEQKAAGSPHDRGRTAEEERAMALDRYQHRIWQLKDRLSCQMYGPHTHGLVDEFMTKFGLQADRSSKEYVWILRKVLQTEIRFYTLLMQRINEGNGDECLFERKMAQGVNDATSSASGQKATSPNPGLATSVE